MVKVQREGIHEIMSRDIMLLKQASKLLKYTPASGLVDFNQVLDEMWVVAQEEMNFQTEAANLERFRKLNEDVAFVTSPILYRQYTTTQVLVMERIDGMGIDKKDELTQAGYDLAEIGAKLADNYVRQIMEDGFFHADPHPGKRTGTGSNSNGVQVCHRGVPQYPPNHRQQGFAVGQATMEKVAAHHRAVTTT